MVATLWAPSLLMRFHSIYMFDIDRATYDDGKLPRKVNQFSRAFDNIFDINSDGYVGKLSQKGQFIYLFFNFD